MQHFPVCVPMFGSEGDIFVGVIVSTPIPRVSPTQCAIVSCVSVGVGISVFWVTTQYRGNVRYDEPTSHSILECVVISLSMDHWPTILQS